MNKQPQQRRRSKSQRDGQQRGRQQRDGQQRGRQQRNGQQRGKKQHPAVGLLLQLRGVLMAHDPRQFQDMGVNEMVTWVIRLIEASDVTAAPPVKYFCLRGKVGDMTSDADLAHGSIMPSGKCVMEWLTNGDVEIINSLAGAQGKYPMFQMRFYPADGVPGDDDDNFFDDDGEFDDDDNFEDDDGFDDFDDELPDERPQTKSKGSRKSKKRRRPPVAPEAFEDDEDDDNFEDFEDDEDEEIDESLFEDVLAVLEDDDEDFEDDEDVDEDESDEDDEDFGKED